MFNLNIPAASLLSVDGNGLCSTPKTPEIVNTLIAMQSPLDNYTFTTINVTSPVNGTIINNGNINNNTNNNNNNNNNNQNNINNNNNNEIGTGIVGTIQQNYKTNSANQQFISQDSSHSSCSGSPLDSPAGTSTTPSVQQTCSQLIKAGLKLSIQSKRKMSSGDSSSGNEQPSRKYSRKSSNTNSIATNNNNNNTNNINNNNCINNNNNNNIVNNNTINIINNQQQIQQHQQQLQQQQQQQHQSSYCNGGSSIYSNDNGTNGETSDDDCHFDQKPQTNSHFISTGLTPEDEDRRRRRRERNKIAATKCRMKKRERTFNLISESETLEKQNIDLKSQVQSLEIERRRIFEMLQIHSCLHPNGYQPPNKFLQSPAYKYLKALGLSNDDDMNNSIEQQTPRTVIPSVDTIKYSRINGLRQQQQHQPIINQNHQTHLDMLPNGYCKASPTAAELGYLNSPTQDVTSTCHLQQILSNSNITNGVTTTATSPLTNGCITQQSQQQQQQQQIQTAQGTLLKTDSPYNIPTTHSPVGTTISTSARDNIINDDTPTVDSTTADFVLKSEYADSPYTTDKSAERFLCETNFDTTFDIKHSNNLNNNNNLNSHNNNHSTLDFNAHLNCSNSYDNLLNIKNDFLTNEELLTEMCGDGPDSEFTDLDTGISYVHNITNGGCLA